MAYRNQPETAFSGYLEVYKPETARAGYAMVTPSTNSAPKNVFPNGYTVAAPSTDSTQMNAHGGYAGRRASTNNRQMSVSNEFQTRVRSSYNNRYDGSSSSYTEMLKEQDFVDRRTGQMGHKQEAKKTYTHKNVDKDLGFTTEVKIEQKVTKTVYPNKSSSKSNNNRINYY
ncbi:unnamed protein product [Malus baccata var. baccata]